MEASRSDVDPDAVTVAGLPDLPLSPSLVKRAVQEVAVRLAKSSRVVWDWVEPRRVSVALLGTMLLTLALLRVTSGRGSGPVEDAHEDPPTALAGPSMNEEGAPMSMGANGSQDRPSDLGPTLAPERSASPDVVRSEPVLSSPQETAKAGTRAGEEAGRVLLVLNVFSAKDGVVAVLHGGQEIWSAPLQDLQRRPLSFRGLGKRPYRAELEVPARGPLRFRFSPRKGGAPLEQVVNWDLPAGGTAAVSLEVGLRARTIDLQLGETRQSRP